MYIFELKLISINIQFKSTAPVIRDMSSLDRFLAGLALDNSMLSRNPKINIANVRLIEPTIRVMQCKNLKSKNFRTICSTTLNVFIMIA